MFTDYVPFFVLLSFLGSNSYKTRELTSKVLTDYVLKTDDTLVIILGSQYKDPEIRYRCRRIMSEYRNIFAPPNLVINDFDDHLFLQGFNLVIYDPGIPSSQKPNYYIQVLFENGFTRTQVLNHIQDAKIKHALSQLSDIKTSLKDTVYFLFPVLDKVFNHDQHFQPNYPY